mmetsp:Transcript_21318/g.32839  ORF Transcript_21318/g.32839 Transcript_21318/m.32839 type:complete len:983 (+) Transcript_21318:157-3105(+)
MRQMISKTTTVTAMLAMVSSVANAKLADRSRIVKMRQGPNGRNEDNGRPIGGPAYRARVANEEFQAVDKILQQKQQQKNNNNNKKKYEAPKEKPAPWKMDIPTTKDGDDEIFMDNSDIDVTMLNEQEGEDRKLSSIYSGCCYNYQNYDAASLCATYGNDCESGETPSHDSGDSDCEHDGLSFIGISFSVNTANGNPYSYQLCDQFPMENIIDREYDYVMSIDEDGWLVGGGYKTFDYSGKMPYIDSSHTELVRIGNMDPDTGGTSIDQVYTAMSSIVFDPISIYPEYLKGGGGHHSNDDGDDDCAESSDVTLVVSIADGYDDDGGGSSYGGYENFLTELFTAMENVGGGPCMDDDDTDPHVSMARGVKFWSAYHKSQYMIEANTEIAVWQAMYPNGVVIGSSGSASFPPGHSGRKQYVGYGNLYFFFDRANITKAFAPARELGSTEAYYSTFLAKNDPSAFYSASYSVQSNYGSGDGGGGDCEYDPYGWKSTSAVDHDATDGWELPPSCKQEGETFFGIPLSQASDSKLQSTSTFQNQFDFEYLTDRNYTYVGTFGTNHGWMVGEEVGNSVGSIVDKDTAHIPLFYVGTTNPNLGGLSLGNMIKVAQHIDFGKLYIKPAFVFVDDDGHAKLQFEADATSALGYLYDSLCKELGISWNYDSPSNSYGLYTKCAMHAAGDRASYGCGPDNGNQGGFCPQMILAYSPRFQSEDHAAAYLERCNSYVDYWRSLYPSGVAVGTNDFCSDGGCLGLFLNRYDLYNVFKPDLGGSWVEYHGASLAPTFSPAPTWAGGCDEPHNFHLDKCFRKRYKPKSTVVAWDALGSIGQFSTMFILFMALTLSISVFVTRAKKKRRKGESYLGFFFRDLTRRKKKKNRGRKVRNSDLKESMLDDNKSRASRRRSKSRGGSRSGRSRSKGRSGRSVSSRKSRGSSSRNRRMRTEALQPSVRSDDSSGVSAEKRGGVMDFTAVQLQPSQDQDDNRQQLV